MTRTLVTATVFWTCFFAPLALFGQEPEHPLKPADRTSPRAALKTFLDAGDAVGTFLAEDYLPAPSRAKFHNLMLLIESAEQSLDLSKLPPASRNKAGRAGVRYLYETLNRIHLPPLDENPEPNQLKPLGEPHSAHWVIPNTEIVLVRSQSGPQSGQFLFSPETVSNADDFYGRVRGLAYTRPVSLENLEEIIQNYGGWMIPYRWIQAMPSWLRTPVAAQPTVENLIGGMNLFADKPIRIGDFCQYGTEIGIIEAIGIRSTRIRGLDRTLTTIPNAALSKMLIINFAQRDRMLIRSVVSVRYETTPEQLRYLLVKIREMLLGHPRIHHDPARARFVGFGASSLDIEVYAYVKTREWSEFLGIREDVLLRIMDWTPAEPKWPKPRCVNGVTRVLWRFRTFRPNRCAKSAAPWSTRLSAPRKRKPKKQMELIKKKIDDGKPLMS